MLFQNIIVASLAATASAATVATSNVKGKAFDRIAIIFFENINFAKAYGETNFKAFAKQGIALTNTYGATHPSQPNYVASVAGDYFGLNHDGYAALPDNVFTVVDLLESKNISWAHYQEDMPYTGDQEDVYYNPLNGNIDYVRKHNPAVHFANVANNPDRLNRIKTFSRTNSTNSQFHDDLNANTLPQWMFITPNMTSDGHNTDVSWAGRWAHSFLTPLLSNKNFNNNTLVVLTWDESEQNVNDPYEPNHILGVLLGDAINSTLVGTEDDYFYNHYSQIASVCANWDLPTLGRWDVGANVFKAVADKTGDTLRRISGKNYAYSISYDGYLNDQGDNTKIPSPNLKLDTARNKRNILPAIISAWKNSTVGTYYKDTIQANDGIHPPDGYAPAL